MLSANALLGDVKIYVRCCEHQIAQLEHLADRSPPARILDIQLAQGVGNHFRSAAVRQDVDLFKLFASGERAKELLEVKDREVAGSAIVHVTAPAYSTARRPCVADRHTLAAQEMPQ